MACRVIGLQHLHQGIAIHLGHHDIRHHQVGLLRQDELHRLLAVAGGHYLIDRLQFGPDKGADLLVVVHHQDLVGGLGTDGLPVFLLLPRPYRRQPRRLRKLERVEVRLLGAQLVGTQVGIAQRNMDDEDASVCVLAVHCHDGPVMQFHQQTCQVQPDAEAQRIGVQGGGSLIEAFEDAFQLVLVDARTGVRHGNLDIILQGAAALGVMALAQDNADISAVGRVLEGIGKDVDQDFIKVVAVNPGIEFVRLVLEGEGDVLLLRLEREELVEVVDEDHEVRPAERHLHLPLVDAADVEQLVEQG